MEDNINFFSWNEYSIEFNCKSKFDDRLIHTGLGLPGIDAKKIIKPSSTVLDVGCGNGVNTNIIANATSNEVIGIDVAEHSIQVAQKKYKRDNLHFYCTDFYSFSSENDQKFDTITFWGSIDYIELTSQFFTALTKITKNKSQCIISKFHPFWTTLFNNDIEEEKLSSYFDNGRKDYVQYGGREKCTFVRYHYNISCLINLFNQNGWCVNTISEPEPDFRTSSFQYSGYDTDELLKRRLNRIPMTLITFFERR